MDRTWTLSRIIKLVAFYLCFYACLSSILAIFLAIFCEMLNYYIPTYQGDESLIGNNPGLGFRPLNPSEPYSSLIWFRKGQEGNWHHYVQNIDEYLKTYVSSDKPGEYVTNCKGAKTLPEKRVCAFPVEHIISNNCSRAREYGFDLGNPCVLIKLNRIYGWTPQPYDYNDFPPDIPLHIRTNYDRNFVYISCDGQTAADKENIGKIQYYPKDGKIPNYYFPFTNLDGYLSPFIFLHFEGPQPNILISVECRAWAKNIDFEGPNKIGSVRFELMVD